MKVGTAGSQRGWNPGTKTHRELSLLQPQENSLGVLDSPLRDHMAHLEDDSCSMRDPESRYWRCLDAGSSGTRSALSQTDFPDQGQQVFLDEESRETGQGGR